MVRSSSEEIVRGFPYRLQRRGRPDFPIGLRAVDGDLRLESNGYSMSFEIKPSSQPLGLTTPGLVVNLWTPHRYVHMAPPFSRLKEMIGMDRSVRKDLGVTQKQYNNALNYGDRGIVHDRLENQEWFGLPADMEVFLRLKEDRKRYDPEGFAEACWILAVKPILKFASYNPGIVVP